MRRPVGIPIPQVRRPFVGGTARLGPRTNGPRPKAPRGPAPTFPAQAALWMIGAIAFCSVGARVFATTLYHHAVHSSVFVVTAFYGPLFAGIAYSSVLLSRRFGTGSLTDDFGLRIRRGDLWRGALVFLVAALLSGIARTPWAHDAGALRASDQVDRTLAALSPIALFEFAVITTLIGPIVEELAFRGVLLRSLNARFAAPVALVLQSVCFGAYHFAPGLGHFNYPFMLGAATFGAVTGWAADRWGRLGAGLVAHVVTNSLFLIAVVATR